MTKKQYKKLLSAIGFKNRKHKKPVEEGSIIERRLSVFDDYCNEKPKEHVQAEVVLTLEQRKEKLKREHPDIYKETYESDIKWERYNGRDHGLYLGR